MASGNLATVDLRFCVPIVKVRLRVLPVSASTIFSVVI
jgi:hypothetical protein